MRRISSTPPPGSTATLPCWNVQSWNSPFDQPFEQLRLAGSEAGLILTGVQVAEGALGAELLPAVAQYGPFHFVAVLGMGESGFEVCDGERTAWIRPDEFHAHFTGRLLTIRPAGAGP